jgi:cytochrome c
MNMKWNMALAAVVSAGIIAWVSGYTSQHVVKVEKIDKDAVTIEAAAAAPVGGAAKASGPEPILELIAAADLERGKSVAKACAACHSFDNGGKNGVGPNLYGVVGKKKDIVAGYAYSGKLEEHGGPTWSYEELNKFLWKPKVYAPGTKMSFVGIKKPEDRAALIAYLRTYNDAPLPSAAEIEKEKADLGPKEEVAAPAPAAATPESSEKK